MTDQPSLTAETLPPIQRPDGSIYRPRKVIAYPLDDDNCDSMTSVVVFGTHDVGRAKALADRLVAEQFDSGYVAVTPRLVWWSDGWSYGRRTFENDSEKGRAGVHFIEIVERTP